MTVGWMVSRGREGDCWGAGGWCLLTVKSLEKKRKNREPRRDYIPRNFRVALVQALIALIRFVLFAPNARDAAFGDIRHSPRG